MTTIQSQIAPAITPLQAKRIVARVIRSAGVQSGSDKPEFVRTRLAKRMTTLGFTSFDEYLAILDGRDGEAEERRLVELLTTHTTSFFREPAHFDWIRDHALPELLEQGIGSTRPLNFWSAAVSTGAEMWTAAMAMEEFRRNATRRFDYKLFGSDVSRSVLKRAATGRFSDSEIKGIPEDLRQKYLLRTPRSYAGKPIYKVLPSIQKKAQLSYANLVELAGVMKIKADIVMLRNVLIYFDSETQTKVARDIAERMRPGGYLFIAHSENLRDRVPDLITVGNAIYQKRQH